MENYVSNKYSINIKGERDYWFKHVLDKWIKYETICPSCSKNMLKLKKIKSIANPYKLQCNNYKCRKIVNIRELYLCFFQKLLYLY